MKIGYNSRFLTCIIQLSLAVMLLFSSCTDEKHPVEEYDNLMDGTPINVSLGTTIPGEDLSQIRLGGEDLGDVQTLKVFVFDKNRRFLYSRTAVIEGQVMEISSSIDENNILPDKKKGGITHKRTISLQLLSSKEKRYIHFFANHDFDENNFPQDFALKGISDGELIAGMHTNKFGEYWSLIELEEGISHNSLNKNIIVKLLRNYAKATIEVDSKVKNFELETFSVYNIPAEGTVAPFISHLENGKLVYDFPFKPNKPTLPSNLTLRNSEMVSLNNTIYFFENSNEKEQHQKTFLILKGKYNNEASTYYKIDFAHTSETGITNLYNIIRNTHYRFKIKYVNAKGHQKITDAVEAPASNNIYASVELEEFSSIAKGKHKMTVSKLGGTFTKSDIFETTILFSGGISHVQYYPSWDQDKDPYMGKMSRTKESGNNGVLNVNIKDIPKDGSIKKYHIDVVGKADDGTIITRKIQFELRKPYQFDAKIKKKGDGTYELSFDVPSSIKTSTLPIEVKISTEGVFTPRNLDDVKKIFLRFEKGKTYYIYNITSTEELGKRATIDFIANKVLNNAKIKLQSNLYEDGEASIDEGGATDTETYSGTLLYYYLNRWEYLKTDSDIEVLLDGQKVSSNKLQLRIVDNYGKYELKIREDVDPYSTLVVRYKISKKGDPEAYRKVTYTYEIKRTVKKWIEEDSQQTQLIWKKYEYNGTATWVDRNKPEGVYPKGVFTINDKTISNNWEKVTIKGKQMNAFTYMVEAADYSGLESTLYQLAFKFKPEGRRTRSKEFYLDEIENMNMHVRISYNDL